jgi:hypothetical protein
MTPTATSKIAPANCAMTDWVSFDVLARVARRDIPETSCRQRPVYQDRKKVIVATLARLTNNADASGRMTKALGDGP